MKLILADDWTGACDTAATAGAPAWVSVNGAGVPPGTGVLVCNTETREASPEEARVRVAAALGALPHPVAYWKMDSMLRGNWAHELAEAMRLGALQRVLVAPAFPEQERVTAGGLQFAHGLPVSEYLHGGSASLWQHLHAAGIPPERFRIADAASPEDLRHAAETLAPGETPVGSAGLARALWTPLQAVPSSVSGSVLAVIGTRSPRSHEQVRPLREHPRVHVIEPNVPDVMERETLQALRRSPPGALLVVGGETLGSLARLLEFQGLLVEGEVAPGVALSRIHGGRLAGLQLISKAGDFGEPGTLASVIRFLV